MKKKVLLIYYGLNSDDLYLLENFCNRIEELNVMSIIYGGIGI